MFSELKHCTATLEGKLTNVSIHEEILTAMVEPIGSIKCVQSNYGKKISPDFKEKPIKTSKRGRPPDARPESFRVKQGSGKCMNSQITFTMIDKNIQNSPYYKIRMFRTGYIEILGSKESKDFNRLYPIIDELCLVMSSILDKKVELEFLRPIMINYTFMAIDTRLYIHNKDLFSVLQEEFKNPYTSDPRDRIISIKYNQERDKFITFKFSTPIPHKPDKKITMIIRNKSKINIYGAHSLEIAKYYHGWFNDLCMRHQELLFIPPENSDTD